MKRVVQCGPAGPAVVVAFGEAGNVPQNPNRRGQSARDFQEAEASARASARNASPRKTFLFGLFASQGEDLEEEAYMKAETI